MHNGGFQFSAVSCVPEVAEFSSIYKELIVPRLMFLQWDIYIPGILMGRLCFCYLVVLHCTVSYSCMRWLVAAI